MNKPLLVGLYGVCLGVTAIVLSGHTLTAQAEQDCSRPQKPAIPDGANASMDDMLAGQSVVKVFQHTNMEYMKCLETAFTRAQESAETAPDAAAQAAYDDAYNAAVFAEEDVAGAFNLELREYKAVNR